jgi:hypothetical protein
MLLLASCTLTARLYDLSNGQVVPAEFSYTGSGAGRIRVTLSDGEALTGEYATIPGGSTAWGSVFNSVYGPAGSSSGAGTMVASSYDNMQKGSAVVTGPKGTVLQCEYVTSLSMHGHGACSDNHGKQYRLMF